jgi:quinol-cytochrome oxidoreductase complex cytochrome b subunit
VNENTLKRFYSLHFLFGLLLLPVISIIHVYFVHKNGSSKPISVEGPEEVVPFAKYFSSKDVYGFLFLFFIFMTVVLLYPLYLAHPDQFVKADTIVTPKHIVPEWYFLPFYAILRSVPNKNFGIFLLGMSLFLLFFMPLIDNSRSALNPRYNIIIKFFFIFSFFHF